MRWHVVTSFIAVQMITGCSSSGDMQTGNTSATGVTGDATQSTINSSFHINLADVPGYNSADPVDDQYLSVVNYLRMLSIKCNDSRGLSGPVGTDLQNESHLQASAREHSEDMRISGHYDHKGSGTASDTTGQALGHASTPRERMKHNGYTGTLTAENIAFFASTKLPEDKEWVHAMEGWMTSTHGHCSSIMNPNLTDFGMHESCTTSPDAQGYYRCYWTQDFGGTI